MEFSTVGAFVGIFGGVRSLPSMWSVNMNMYYTCGGNTSIIIVTPAGGSALWGGQWIF